MKFRASGVIPFLLFLLVASASGAAENWQLTVYDKAEALFVAFDQKEAELLKQYEPRIAEFYAVYGPFQDADRKMRRYGFLKQVKQNPQDIDWTKIWGWARGWDVGTKEQEKLASEDPAYRALREDFLAKKDAFKKAKELTRLRNAVFEKHAEIFHGFEENLLAELKKLQAEVDQWLSNTPLEPSR